MLRIIPCLLLAGLGCFALPPKVMAQSAPLSDEPAVLQGQAKKHFENDQALDAERKYLAALKVYEKGLADKNQSDALLLRWCRCRNELTEVQFCLYKLSEPKALAATTMAYLQQVIPLRAKEPAFRLELAKTHQALSEGDQFLQLFVDAEKHQRTAIELLGQLVKDYPSTAEYRSTLAKGLKNHGGMLMGLARFAEAESAYAEAERIAAKLVADAPQSGEFTLDLAMIFNAHALLIRESGRFPQAVEAMSAATRLLAKMEADYPDRPEYWAPLATIYRNLAQPLGYLGRAADAEAVLKEAGRVERKLAQLPPSARWSNSAERLGKQQQEMENLFKQTANLPPSDATIPFIYTRKAILLSARGQQLFTAGQRDEARRQFEQAIGLLEKLNERQAGLPIHRSLLAAQHFGLGNAILSEGPSADGDACLRRGLALLAKSTQEAPQVPSFRYFVHEHLMRVVMNLSGRSHVKEAIRYLAEVQEIEKKLAEDYPLCPQYRRLQAQSPSTLARMAQANQAIPQAEEALREGIRLWAKMCTDFPAITDYRKSWSKDYGLLGQLMIRRDKDKEAGEAFGEMLKLNEKLLSEHPREPEYHTPVAITHLWLAQVHERQGRRAEAIEDDTRAIALWESALQLNPRQRSWLNELRASIVHRAGLLLKEQNQPAYLHDLERAKGLAEFLEAPLFRLYRIEERGQKSEMVQVALKEADDLFQNTDLSDAEWHRLAVFYVELAERTANVGDKNAMAARAVVALNQAIRLGLSRATLREDERLRPLTPRDDFRRLMQGN